MPASAMDDDTMPAPLTFSGRLRVADFAYKGEDAPQSDRVLRSRQKAGALSALASSEARLPRPSSKSSKRRAADDDLESGAVVDEAAADTAVDTTARLSPRKSPSKRSRSSGSSGSSRYAPPSTYAHLNLLPDALGPGLLVLFVGLNPGVQTARSGHAYAHPSNLFWKLLYRSGITSVACRPEEDRSMPARFRLGQTNIVARPSRNGGELRPSELDDGVAALEAKAWRWRPEAVCIVGKSIWESIVRVRYGVRYGGSGGGGRGKKARPRPRPAFHYGWQDEPENMGRVPPSSSSSSPSSELTEQPTLADGVHDDPNWKGARVFVASSTSGLAASLSMTEKEAIWRQLGSWVEQRRHEIEAETGQKWV